MDNKAVILGNNYYIGLSTMRCLGIHGISTVAMDYSEDERYAADSKYCTEKIIVPHYQKETGKFITALIEYAKMQEAKPVLIPCHDSYVEVIDAHLNTLKEYYLIPQTQQGLYTTVMNKETLHSLALKEGISVPRTVDPNDDNFYDVIEKEISFPCLVKPVDSPSFVSHFRRKLFKVYSMEELNDALAQASEANLEVIVQQIIPGFDDHMYTFDAYINQEGKVTHWVTCQKLRQYPINFGASVYTVQKHIPELYDIGAKFLEKINFKGFAEIEFKKDANTGEFYLIEINARITNLNHLLYKVGINFPYITYMELVGKPLEPKSVNKNTNRAFWYGYEDLLAIRDYVRDDQLTVGEVLRSLVRPKAYAILDFKDPKPAISYSKIVLKKLLKKFR